MIDHVSRPHHRLQRRPRPRRGPPPRRRRPPGRRPARNTEKADGLRRELPGLADVLVRTCPARPRCGDWPRRPTRSGPSTPSSTTRARLPRAGPRPDRGRARPHPGGQRARALPAHGPHASGRPPRLPHERPARTGRDRPRRPRLDRAPVGREAGVLRLQALRRDTGRGDRPPEAGHRLDLGHTGLGGDEDGRRRGAGRLRRRLDHPGLARRLGRPGRAAQRRALLPPGAAHAHPAAFRRGSSTPSRSSPESRCPDAQAQPHPPPAVASAPQHRPWPGARSTSPARRRRSSPCRACVRDDGRPRLLVDAVRLADVDVRQPRGGERGDELVTGSAPAMQPV